MSRGVDLGLFLRNNGHFATGDGTNINRKLINELKRRRFWVRLFNVPVCPSIDFQELHRLHSRYSEGFPDRSSSSLIGSYSPIAEDPPSKGNVITHILL